MYLQKSVRLFPESLSAKKRNHCPFISGMTVRYKTEWVSVYFRNHCPPNIGMGVRLFPEYAVHGSIWVLCELVEHKIISKSKGIELLELMKSVNTRLPIDEIDKLIKQLK